MWSVDQIKWPIGIYLSLTQPLILQAVISIKSKIGITSRHTVSLLCMVDLWGACPATKSLRHHQFSSRYNRLKGFRTRLHLDCKDETDTMFVNACFTDEYPTIPETVVIASSSRFRRRLLAICILLLIVLVVVLPGNAVALSITSRFNDL